MGIDRSYRVALATCRELPDLDADERELLRPLAQRGVEARAAVWDDAGEDWAAYDAVVIRSAWDYVGKRDRFLEWARSVPLLMNAAPVVEWNTDKRYLTELGSAGLPVVWTRFFDPDDEWHPQAGEYVVKPAVSAGSRDSARYEPGEDGRAREHVARLQAAGRTVMVQPYVNSVDQRGETALLYIGGEYSHAIRKGPLLARGQGMEEGLFRAEDIRLRAPSPREVAAADRVVDWARKRFGDLLYARVDLVEEQAGRPIVLELELTEPSLFLGWAPGAADRLADAIVARLDSAR